ncbi:FecCD family ABC transporter permease [Pseudactinotalea suaedae]|uniref:FecCD family ABC transporter permease n=1 Tax=Pseudactinotalea suaedae TaxID=1524924 RepID=UPI0012E0D6E1|nr:iron ABC transporter permease [Pseudactinotalea suaedae]
MTATLTVAPAVDRSRRPVSVRVLATLGLVALVVLVGLASVTFGVLDVSWDDLVAGIGGGQETTAQAAVLKRMPRTVLGLVIGAALGVSGAVMQGVTRNPLADPEILGVNSGASLAVVIGMVFLGLSSQVGYIWVAMVGAAIAAVFVYVVGSLGRGGATPLKLALAGAATSVALGAIVSAILLPRAQDMQSFRFWQIGGVGGGSWGTIGLVLPFLAAGMLLSLASARALNSLALGDELAAGLGENVMRARLLAAVGGVVLCGAATAVAGPIGFVGLVVPHVVRLLAGVDHRWLIPLSALAGAALLTAADVVGRLVGGTEEIQAGIITAILGAPFFIWIVRRQKVRDL